MLNKKTAQYQLTKKFLLIFFGVLLIMNLFYLLGVSKFVYEFVETKTENIISTIRLNKENQVDWTLQIDNYVTKDDALKISDTQGNNFYSKEGNEIFEELYRGKSIPLINTIIFSDEGIYYVAKGHERSYDFELAVSMEDAFELANGMFVISLLLNFFAVIFGGILIYFSVQKWSIKLSKMSKEITEIDMVNLTKITVPSDPIEINEVAMAFNELLEEQKEAIEREKQFITNASHDLRTPLAAIRGHVKLIKRRGDTHPEIVPTSIDFIDKESKRLEALSNQLLTMEKKELNMEREEVNLSEIVRQEIEKIKQFDSRKFNSTILDNVLIEAGRVEMQQVIQNLIENAVKYSAKESNINVELTVTTESIIFEVADEGIGIPDEHKKRVFERFYRVDHSRTSDIEGSGIGLSIVKKIVDSYNGEISIKDNQQKGSIFIIKLPKEKMKKSSSSV